MLTGLGLSALAQSFPAVRFESLSIEDGLPSVQVWDILQDRQGFLWIATENGLVRYDGREVTVFRSDGPGTLSHNQVWSLLEDHAGVLWVGTYQYGLNRFDPTTETFTQYRHDPEDPTSLGDRDIRVLYESPSQPGVLWIGTNGAGLNRFDTRTETFTRYPPDPSDPTRLPNINVFAIHEDAAGTLWVGTGGGLSRMHRNPTGVSEPEEPDARFTTYQPEPYAETQTVSVNAIVEDDTGMLWLSTRTGVQRFDPSTLTFTPVGVDEANVPIRTTTLSLLQDRNGLLWAATGGNGLLQIDSESGRSVRYRHEPGVSSSLSNDFLRTVYEDRHGILWVGTWGGGVSKIQPERFPTYYPRRGLDEALASGYLNALAEGPKGEMWVGYQYGGLVRMSPPGEGPITYEHYRHEPGNPNTLSSNQIEALHVAPEDSGVVWIGTRHDGLNRLNPSTGTLRSYRPAYTDSSRTGIPFVLALATLPCTPGWLWVGTDDGVQLFNKTTGTFTPLDLGPTTPPSMWIQPLVVSEGADCSLWFSGNGGGVRYMIFEMTASAPLHPGEPPSYAFTHFTPATGTRLSNALWQTLFAQTPDGRLWFGGSTTSRNLVAFDPATETEQVFGEADGLPGDRVFSIQTDTDGTLWIGLAEGLVRMDPHTNTFRTFDLGGNVPVWRGVHRGPSGRLYFAGHKGVVTFRPDEVVENEHIPPVVLTGLRIGDQRVPVRPDGIARPDDPPITLQRSISYTDAITLPPDANVLTLSFAALDFAVPDKNQYRYKLEGFDEAWHDAGTNNEVTYTNLDPGRYTFRVIGSNNDGVWNEEGARLAITVLPPWYQSRWAYAAYVLLLIGSVVGLVSVRERRLRQRATELETAVDERTEQLQQQQSQLEQQAEALSRQTHELAEANEMKSRFLANISHEFRTPLTLTLGPIRDLLAGRFSVDEAAHPHLESAQRNGHRLLNLINQLLELSRLDAGALLLHAERRDLAQHLREIGALFADLARRQGLHLKIDVPSEPLWHMFDAEKIERVVINLLSNALKFTPPGGEITLTLRREADGNVGIKVFDTGHGIAREHLPRLFDRFYQVEQAATRSHEGSGIGLALVKELVELHKGTIAVESTVGVGTRFMVELPPGRYYGVCGARRRGNTRRTCSRG